MRERLGASEAEVERAVDDEGPVEKMKVNPSALAAGKSKKVAKKNKEKEEGELLRCWRGVVRGPG